MCKKIFSLIPLEQGMDMPDSESESLQEANPGETSPPFPTSHAQKLLHYGHLINRPTS